MDGELFKEFVVNHDEEMPPEMQKAFDILSGKGQFEDVESNHSIHKTSQEKFIESRSKKELEYSISGMEVMAFDLRNQQEADKYSEFMSRIMPLCMTNPKEHKVKESPIQLLQFPDGEFKAVALVRYWKETSKHKLITPEFNFVAKTNEK